jgi:hypothetical protein
MLRPAVLEAPGFSAGNKQMRPVLKLPGISAGNNKCRTAVVLQPVEPRVDSAWFQRLKLKCVINWLQFLLSIPLAALQQGVVGAPRGRERDVRAVGGSTRPLLGSA